MAKVKTPSQRLSALETGRVKIENFTQLWQHEYLHQYEREKETYYKLPIETFVRLLRTIAELHKVATRSPGVYNPTSYHALVGDEALTRLLLGKNAEVAVRRGLTNGDSEIVKVRAENARLRAELDKQGQDVTDLREKLQKVRNTLGLEGSI